MAEAMFEFLDSLKQLRKKKGFEQILICSQFLYFPLVLFCQHARQHDDIREATAALFLHVLQHCQAVRFWGREVEKKEMHVVRSQNGKRGCVITCGADVIPLADEGPRNDLAERSVAFR